MFVKCCKAYATNISFIFIIHSIVILCILLSELGHCNHTASFNDNHNEYNVSLEMELPPNHTAAERIKLAKAKKSFLHYRCMSRKYEKNNRTRPPYTFKRLIFQALLEAPQKKLTINEIYKFFMGKYAYYKSEQTNMDTNWKISIITTLSRKNHIRLFLRSTEEHVCHACHNTRIYTYWKINPEVLDRCYEEAYIPGRPGPKHKYL